MAEEETTLGAVYVPWATFNNAITGLADSMPTRIDKSVFKLSGGVTSQLLTGLKFLGLTGKDGKPTPMLHALAVKDEAERKKQVAKMLRASYAALFSLDLGKTTTNELRETMQESYGIKGGTVDRAMRFFISAAQYAGVTLSTHVTAGSKTVATSSAASTTRRRRNKGRKNTDGQDGTNGVKPQDSAGESMSIGLASGGTLTLLASAKFFSMPPKERDFVFGLIDKMNEYAAANSTAKEEEGDDEEQ